MSVDQFLLSADTTDLNYPEIRPTLDLNFARTKTLDPRITFTRSSGGSYVGADGLIKYAGVNEARFDHDPSTGESLGLLIEEARTNLLLWSEDISKSNYAVSGDSYVLDVTETTSPYGDYTADKFIETITGTPQMVTNISSSNIAENSSFTASVFVKPIGNRDKIRIAIQSSTAANFLRSHINLRTRIVENSGQFGAASYVNSGVIVYPNNWYRVYITGTLGTTTTNINPRVLIQAVESFPSVGSGGLRIGDGVSGVFVWGAQLEVGRFPTSYIPTQASTRTRAVDNAFIGGNEFFNIFNENEGTFFSKSKTSGQGSGAFFVGDINTQPISQDYIDILRYQLSFLRAGISLQETEGTSVAINSTLPLGDVYKAVHAYNLNKSVLYVDGNFIGRINSRKRIIPKNLKILQIGKHRSGFYLNGHIYRLTYFNRLLQDSQLQALTR